MQREAEKEVNKIKKQNAKLKTINKVDVKIVTARMQFLKWLFRITLQKKTHFFNGAIATEKNVELIIIN